MKSSLFVFGVGNLGTLLALMLLFLLQILGLNHFINMPNLPLLSGIWLYPKLVWGGLFALAFLLPFMNNQVLFKGVIVALLITLVGLVIPLPFSIFNGARGLSIGLNTFALLFAFNLVWALITSLMIKLIK